MGSGEDCTGEERNEMRRGKKEAHRAQRGRRGAAVVLSGECATKSVAAHVCLGVLCSSVWQMMMMMMMMMMNDGAASGGDEGKNKARHLETVAWMAARSRTVAL